MTTLVVVIVVVIWLICGVIAMLIGQKKNQNLFGSFVTGALLGLIGIVLMLRVADRTAQGPRGDGRRQVPSV